MDIKKPEWVKLWLRYLYFRRR